jgi:predicted dehydrogenase
MALRRRGFLKLAGTAGGGLLAARVAAAVPASNLRIGVITAPAGGHASLFVQALTTCPGVGEVAFCDPSGESLGRLKAALGSMGAGARTFADHRELMTAFKPELVFVTVEPVQAPPLIEAALAAGAHVVSEKPPCVRLADFERVAALAAAKDRALMLALPTRVTVPARKARELVERGYLGKVYGVDMTWIADQTRLRNPKYHQTWMAQKARAGGGQLIFHGIHYLDAVEYILGDSIVRVAGFVHNVGGQPLDVEDAAVVSLAFRGGPVGTLNCGYYLDKDYENRLTVWGSSGWLRFGFTSAAQPLEWYSTHPEAPKGIQRLEYSEQDGYRTFTHEAVQAARGVTKQPITAAQGVHVLRTVFAAYRAAETGTAQTVA